MVEKTNDMGTPKSVILKLTLKTNKMNSKLKYLLGVIIGSAFLVSCEINDPVTDLVRTGKLAANVYMEIPTGNVTAGDSVDFHAEYWSVDNKFNSLAIWYSINTNLSYTISSGLNDYMYKLDSTELARELQEIEDYEHKDSNYSTEKKAYIIDDKFPVSYTLAGTELKNPIVYDESIVLQLFPASVIEQFYNGVFETLNYDQLNDLMVINNNIVDSAAFETYFETIQVEDPDNEGEFIDVKVIKDESKSDLLKLFKEVPFEDLIYNASKQYYGLFYQRIYKLNVKFRVVNGNDVENFSTEKTITVN